MDGSGLMTLTNRKFLRPIEPLHRKFIGQMIDIDVVVQTYGEA